MKVFFPCAAALLALAFLTSCGEPKAKTDQPLKYNQGGMSFQFPGNWKVTDVTQDASVHFLFVESPGDATLIIQLFSEVFPVPEAGPRPTRFRFFRAPAAGLSVLKSIVYLPRTGASSSRTRQI